MFFRRFPAEAWPRLAGVLAARFGWTPDVLESLDSDGLEFWLERLEELDKKPT